ncbi:surface-adhesin E family protein [Stenotrophomonas koreensis]|uniref:surface-adhesin E family protein n=1 Tax=Stenotrophomonas koreensis TaxID=266128 RepID=UPI003394323E
MRISTLLPSLALAMVSHVAVAGWIPIDSPPNRTIYADLKAARESGDLITLWVLIDHDTVQKEADDSYLSSKGQWEINCKENSARQLFHVIYPGHMGGGDTIWSGSLDRQLQPIVPGSIGQTLFEAACDK